MMMDVSDLGSHPGCENGISLGEGWRLQISGVVVRGRRKSLAMPSPQEGLEVVREWGVPLLLSAPEVAPEGQRPQSKALRPHPAGRFHDAMASLALPAPRAPLGPAGPSRGRPRPRRAARGLKGSKEVFAGRAWLGAALVGRVLRRVATFPEDMTKIEPVGAVYVHIPFCRQRCQYCDFAIDVPKAAAFEDRVARYVDCLVEEIRQGGAGDLGQSYASKPLQSLYFGGGTPSLLPELQLERVMAALRQRFELAPDCEITVEMAAQAILSPTLAQRSCVCQGAVGFQRLSGDLLSGVPGQSAEALAADVRQLAAEVDHLSVYDLQYEPGTKFARRFPSESPSRPTAAQAARLYETAHEELGSLGFEHYEVSNYARSRETRSRHNQTYWNRSPYAAFGLGAASFVRNLRATRPRKLEDYCAWIEGRRSTSAALELDGSQRDCLQDAICEAAMLSLRTRDGLHLRATTGAAAACLEALREALARWEPRLQLDTTTAGELRARLTAPGGFLVSDAVLSDAFASIMSLDLEPKEKGAFGPGGAPKVQRQILSASGERSTGARNGVHSLELFAGSASMMTCEQITPRPTLGTMDCTEDMEAHDVWEGQEIGHVRTDSYLVAQNSLAPPGSQRPSIIRRRSRTASTPEVVPEGVVLEGAGAPVAAGAVLLGKEAKLQSDDQSSEVKEDTPRQGGRVRFFRFVLGSQAVGATFSGLAFEEHSRAAQWLPVYVGILNGAATPMRRFGAQSKGSP
ncbi:unnamed protein product [Effrenium voratum]|nr:unnamed protein product [Effrenium voratum]